MILEQGDMYVANPLLVSCCGVFSNKVCGNIDIEPGQHVIYKEGGNKGDLIQDGDSVYMVTTNVKRKGHNLLHRGEDNYLYYSICSCIKNKCGRLWTITGDVKYDGDINLMSDIVVGQKF